MKAKKSKTNMTGMADGMYFVNLISSGQQLSGKIIKY
jgi:hypothetical protein